MGEYAMTDEPRTAKIEQIRNDLYWKIWDKEDGNIRWIGYNDKYWWDVVSKSDNFRRKVGPISGRIYVIDPQSGKVTIEARTAIIEGGGK